MTPTAKQRRDAKHAARHAEKQSARERVYAYTLEKLKGDYIAKAATAPYYAFALENPELLSGAVVHVNRGTIECGIGELAIPVGGKRRGGSVQVSRPLADQAVSTILERGTPQGFPNLRIASMGWMWSGPDCDVYVEWGAPRPVTADGERELDGTILGRYYGYTEAAIAAHAALEACPCKYCGLLRTVQKYGWTGKGLPNEDNPIWGARTATMAAA